MAGDVGKKIVRSGLVLGLDAADPGSYISGSTSWNDLSGNGNAASLLNGVGYNASNLGSLTFNGSNQVAVCSNSNSINISGNLTMSCWVFLNSSWSSDGTVIHKDLQYSLHVWGDRTVSYADSSNWSYSNFGKFGLVPLSTWKFLCAKKEGTTVTLFLDNNVIASKTFGTAISTTNSSLHVGCYSNGGSVCTANWLNGRVSNTFIYNRALSNAEILQNFETQRTRFGV